jgi:hypothetical protein
MLRQKRTTVGLLTCARTASSHRQMREGPRIGQYQACNTLLCRRQGRKGGGNAIKHIGADEVEAMNACRKSEHKTEAPHLAKWRKT